MGDRHNIGIVQEDSRWGNTILWLYSHSGFWSDVPGVEGFSACLALAIDEARPRWEDPAYFTRIVIHSLGESVRGISAGTAIGDEHKRWVVNPVEQSVSLVENYPWDGSYNTMPTPLVTLSFEDFVKKYRKHEATVRNEY